MKIEKNLIIVVAAALLAAIPAIPGSMPKAAAVPAQLVVTVLPGPGGSGHTTLEAADLTVVQGNTAAPVVRLQRLSGDLANMQLFVLLDDSTRSASLGLQLPELKSFIQSLPASTEVAAGYMQNGSFALAHAFTTDHEKVADALRLPLALAGENGSPYFALSDLVKHWPSKQATKRRAVLMLTDGVDRYYGPATVDDPYADAAVNQALKEGVMVYSIYLRGAGRYGRGDWTTTIAQSRLMDVSEETGGYAYFQDFTDPVTVLPFLNDLKNRLENQYQVTFQALNQKGVQPVKLRTELPGLKIQSPTHIYVP